MSDEELVAYYDIADLFLCASEHEGFCVPLVEAFYKEIPVLAYAATAVPATMDGARVLFDDKGIEITWRRTDGRDSLQHAPAGRRRRRADGRGRAAAGEGFCQAPCSALSNALIAPRAARPAVTDDFWQQFDAAEKLEEMPPIALQGPARSRRRRR